MSFNESKKHLAAELAEKIYKDGPEFAQLLGFTGLLDSEHNIMAPQKSDSEHVGIWKKNPQTGDFERDMAYSADWNFWAQQSTISAKKTAKRLVLAGESVARGMLYDPGYTPSQVLSTMLEQAHGESVEVIDLARTNADISVLQEVVEASEQLSPDIIVIFAGNNWVGNRAYLSSLKNAYEISDSIKTAGVAGLKARLTQALNQEISTAMAQINQQSTLSSTEIVWVLPEFNLADWKDPDIHAHWLETEKDNQRWRELKKQADLLYAQGDYKACIECANDMLVLDEGSCSATAYLFANSYEQLGEYTAMRQYLEMARDSSIIDLSRSYTPRITNEIREVMIECAANHGNSVINLKEVFQAHSSNGIPGKELFLDYCHLTSKGIRIAMAEVASHLGDQSVSASQLIDDAPNASEQDEADAHLLAAIHNAHWGQNFDVVSYYCNEAAKKSVDILKVMQLFVELQNKRLPIWMNESLSSALEDMSPQVKRYLFSMGANCLDQLLFEAFETCANIHGVALGDIIRGVQLQQHAVDDLSSTNLLDPYFHSVSFSEQQLMEGGHNTRHDFYKAYLPSSTFTFFTDGSQSRTVKATLKLNNEVAKQSCVVIKVNGKVLDTVTLSEQWSTTELLVPTTLLVSGANKLEIEWPEQRFDSSLNIRKICKDINSQLIPELYPMYGNIYSLVVR
ncbi:MAG TPA: hypothetical protein ENI26_13720 [Methylophaga aminisulfidivorans]|uniref:Uncharacterized protein n=2 Tax=root TaxID=1 RepID=A0A7C1W1T0_9GAMM|nr:hypothetical protein [Methylophaga sp.]HEC75404.1 hypothetical protein [Methylophaga aminisulfidivorans]